MNFLLSKGGLNMKSITEANAADIAPIKGTSRVSSFFLELKGNWVFFLMLLPGLIVLFLNNYLPMSGLVLAFKDYNYVDGLWGSKWSGFENFRYLFMSGKAFIITRNTILYNLVFIFISITIPVLLAIIITELRNQRAAKVYQTMFFLPYFLSWVIVSYLVYSFLSTDAGVLNLMLKKFGYGEVNWYTEPKYWPFFLVIINTWKWAGYDAIVFMASICGFDKTYYEAAAVDGATKFQQIAKITLPLLKPVIIILTLLKVGRIFSADFGLFYVVPRNSGVLNNVTDVIDTFVYRGLQETGDFSMATAAGLYQSFVGFVLICAVNYIVKKVDSENSLF